jgi:hypothetical protein
MAPPTPLQHRTFSTVTIHTAKCDLCNQRNKSTLQRCTLCGWSICEACFLARKAKAGPNEPSSSDDTNPAAAATGAGQAAESPAGKEGIESSWTFEGGHVINEGDSGWSAERAKSGGEAQGVQGGVEEKRKPAAKRATRKAVGKKETKREVTRKRTPVTKVAVAKVSAALAAAAKEEQTQTTARLATMVDPSEPETVAALREPAEPDEPDEPVELGRECSVEEMPGAEDPIALLLRAAAFIESQEYQSRFAVSS